LQQIKQSIREFGVQVPDSSSLMDGMIGFGERDEVAGAAKHAAANLRHALIGKMVRPLESHGSGIHPEVDRV
jgi:hypothetical protein